MSYNTTKVNNQVPNNSGEISLNIGDIITINTPVIGQILQKKSTNWGTSNISVQLKGLLNHYYPEGTSFGIGSYEHDVDDNIIFRKASNFFNVQASGVTTPNAAGSYVPLSTSSWTDGFTFSASAFPVGSVVLLRAQITPVISNTSTYATYQWRIGTRTALSNTIPIGPIAKNVNGYGATVFGLFQSTGSDTAIGVKVLSKNGSVRLTNPSQSRILQVTAKRLS